MTVSEYRKLVAALAGRRPPCLECTDKTVKHCMQTGRECMRFEKYSGTTGADNDVWLAGNGLDIRNITRNREN